MPSGTIKTFFSQFNGYIEPKQDFTTGVRKMGKKCKVKLDVGTVYQKEEGGNYYFRYQVQHERKCVT